MKKKTIKTKALTIHHIDLSCIYCKLSEFSKFLSAFYKQLQPTLIKLVLDFMIISASLSPIFETNLHVITTTFA